MSGEFTELELAELMAQLDDYLGPTIPRALQDDSVVELSVNHDGVLRIARMGGATEATGECWSYAAIMSLLSVIATLQGTTIRRNNPIVETWIPKYGARIEGVVPPAVTSPIFSIRRPSTRIFTLNEYVASERMTREVSAVLRQAITSSLNVLVVGGTGSGKTTLVNALLDEINLQFPNLRLAILEDTRELICMSPSWFQLQTVRPEPGHPEVNLDHLLHAALRLYPKRIVVGELRGVEIMSFLRAANTGHPGLLSTVHANSCETGLLRLEQLGAYATGRPVPRSEIAEAVQMVVFVTHGANGPCVRNVVRVLGATGDGYALEELAS